MTKKKIEVTAVFHPNGDIHPLQFVWKDRTFRVLATGRHWQDEHHQHFLVMVEGERIFELIFSAAESCWYLGQRSSNEWIA